VGMSSATLVVPRPVCNVGSGAKVPVADGFSRDPHAGNSTRNSHPSFP
jgi:hypothetical protein